jgi:hypothetical protein
MQGLVSKSEGKAWRGVGGKASQGRRADTRRSAMQRKGIAKKHFDTICNGCAVCAMYGKGIDMQIFAKAWLRTARRCTAKA